VLHGDGSERLALLREAVARIEAKAGLSRDRRPKRGRGAWEESGAPEVPIRLGDGSLRFDERLGGGLRPGTLHEIVAAHRQDDGAAAGFAAALAVRCAGAGPLVWIVEDCAAFETGAPYRPGLAGHGIDPDRLILVRTRDAPMTLWACEEALRLRAPVVLAELWNSKHYGLAASRRLLLAAQAGRGTALLLHTGLSGRASGLSSAAETRFLVASCPSPRLVSAGNRMPIPGTAAFAVRLLKQRLRAVQGLDRDRIHFLVWNPAQRCFDDHPVPFGFSAPIADRSPAAADRSWRKAAQA
jgi:protein ImuA